MATCLPPPLMARPRKANGKVSAAAVVAATVSVSVAPAIQIVIQAAIHRVKSAVPARIVVPVQSAARVKIAPRVIQRRPQAVVMARASRS